jgi:TRAP-type transport system periplasmic protein
MKSVALFLSLVAVAGVFPAAAGAQDLILRVAANAPTNSPWDLGLQRMAAEFDRVSEGRVRIVFPPTAHVSSESDIIQKMRLGVDGALLTSYGLAELYPDSLALSMPGLINDDKEFDAVLAAAVPLIKSKLAARYEILAIAKGGWIRYFSKSPIVYPSDLARQRISLDPGNEKGIRLMESYGARVITGTTSDFLLQINSNAVDAACVSPIFAAALWSQLRGKIEYMSSFKVAPFIGAMVFNKSSWDKVPSDLRPRLEDVVRRMAVEIGLESIKLEADAIASLDGIRIPPVSADAKAMWEESVSQRRGGIIAEMFSPDILDTIDAALLKARQGN